jgi:hypothetical protein
MSESEEARKALASAAAAMTSVRISGRSMLLAIGKVPEMVRQAALRRELEGCHLLAGVWCHGLTVAQLRSIRASLPPMARLLVTEISDVAAAVAGTRWEALELSVKLTPVLHCIMLKCSVLTLTQRACNLLMIFVYFQTIAMVSL